MKRKKDGYGFVVTLLLLGWLIGSPAPVEPVPADDTPAVVPVEAVSVIPSPPDEKGGGLGSPAHDEPVRVTDDPSSFVHRIHVRNGSTGGQGSATHIGDGVYLTCRHVLGRAVSGVEIDGVPASASWNVAWPQDVGVVRTRESGPAARVNTAPLSDGQSLRVVGQKTGMHSGELSPKRWSHGYRAVVCAVPTESGDSGAGVFNDAGELVGVHWGSTGNEVFFTPLNNVAALVAPFTPDSAARSPTEPGADTSVCACEGSKRGVCHCLARGVTCRCKTGVGSEWEMADGRPVKKTGRYLDPRSPLVEPMLVVTVGDAKPSADTPQQRDGKWWWTAPDGVRWWAAKQPQHGDSVVGDGVTWDCVNGRMVLRGAKMAVQIQPPKRGYWKTVCRGSYCERVWVSQ